ncbi:type III secretion system ATPase SctN [Caballeronia calidae]|nr:type III secretion system ATPase SctN [Caballeronia calidae]
MDSLDSISFDAVGRSGKIVEVIGTLIRATGIDATLGELCELRNAKGERLLAAEVVGFTRSSILLSPFGHMDRISRATQVTGTGSPLSIRVGPELLGRVVDCLGNPLDGLGSLETSSFRSVIGEPPNPMSRTPIHQPLATGVRAIDGFTTIGEGQRLGIFAPAGVGKSTLLGMLACRASADVNVIGLIGERGREVREFVERTLGVEGLSRSVIVCATSDRSAIERAKAAHAATAIAEYFRDQGKKVLLMMDSLTRFARAQREIGLAAGEPPARRGFPPSTFSELGRLLERAGPASIGSITALYTVLLEDEESSDPVGEEVRSIVDGHLVLSRDLATQGQYPAIDVLASLSRLMSEIASKPHIEAATFIRKLLAKHREIDVLIKMGEYRPGSDRLSDLAIRKIEDIKAFISQTAEERIKFETVFKQLVNLCQQ